MKEKQITLQGGDIETVMKFLYDQLDRFWQIHGNDCVKSFTTKQEGYLDGLPREVTVSHYLMKPPKPNQNKIWVKGNLIVRFNPDLTPPHVGEPNYEIAMEFEGWQTTAALVKVFYSEVWETEVENFLNELGAQFGERPQEPPTKKNKAFEKRKLIGRTLSPWLKQLTIRPTIPACIAEIKKKPGFRDAPPSEKTMSKILDEFYADEYEK